MRTMKREGLWGFWAVLVALCAWGCGGEGEDGGGGLLVIPDDEPDMSKLVDASNSEESLNIILNRWIDSYSKLADYDCECSQGEAWSPVWNKDVCLKNWKDYYGNDVAMCVSEALLNYGSVDELNYFVSCSENNNINLLKCFGVDYCQDNKSLVNDCLADWNDGRIVCNLEGYNVSNVFKKCGYDLKSVDQDVLKLVYWEAIFSSEPEISTAYFLGFDKFKYFKSSCEGVVRCTVSQVNFRNDGFYSSYFLSGVLGSANSDINESSESGIWFCDGERDLVVSSDCKTNYDQGFVWLAFQRIFFENIYLRRADFLMPNATELEMDVDNDYACGYSD
jgi:hypothetical protein